MAKFSFIDKDLSKQKQLNRLRQRQLVSEQDGREIVVDNQRYLNFSSNDYLGLNKHPKIAEALMSATDQFGASSCSSNLVTGYSYYHQALENEICTWLNKPKCLLFNSGFSANVGVLSALANKDTQFLLDKLSHASLIDGAYADQAQVKRYRHNDHQQLENYLSKNTQLNQLIISEGVFSMDGDQADVKQLSTLAKQSNAWLYMDDAHSLGVIGDTGQGSSYYSNSIDIVMGTFGKALATSGAFIACDETLHDYLLNYARHYIYSTAISPAIASATIASIKLVQQEQWRRDKIAQLSALFVSKLENNIDICPTSSSIHAIVLGSEQSAIAISEKLKIKKIWLTAIRPPTVAKNTSRLRVTICANHNVKDINYLAESLNRVIN